MIATILWIMSLMTGDQSRLLRSGDRISWEDSATDQGTIANINWSSVEIVAGGAFVAGALIAYAIVSKGYFRRQRCFER